ncbi:gp22 [Corynebacterium phage BFK20]|uniref:Gp22 n=1 Tax=Corynebacterium phage BFK20 TaxID=28358 RepID=Q9MBI2_9CAUD|nr:tail protein [Corynebacterium phage BFK20]CAB93928.2 gp22 [Corynebacterium phage BFK20]
MPTSQIPEVALTKPSQVTSRAAMLALNAQEGDIAIITAGADKGTYILGSGSSTVFSSWLPMAVSSDVPIQSVNGQVGTVVLTATDVGASPTSHTHTPASLGAAPATHNHTVSQISDLPPIVSDTAQPWSVARRYDGGRVRVGIPVVAEDASPKSYVDAKIAGATDDGYNTRAATDVASTYPAGVSVSLNNVTSKGWSAVIGAASLPSLGSFAVVTTVRQSNYDNTTWQYLSSFTDHTLPILVRKWTGEAWSTLRRLTDDGHTHTSAQISDTTASLVAGALVKREADSAAVRVGNPNQAYHATPKSYVDTGLSNVYTEVYRRPALFSGAGAPPSSIPGALVGDWWLNTTTMQLYKITAV